MNRDLLDRAEQQAAVASLGLRALSGLNFGSLQSEAVTAIAKVLGLGICELVKFDSNKGTFCFVAGVDCESDRTELANGNSGKISSLEFALRSNTPVTVDDIRTDPRFEGSDHLRNLGVVSSINVAVGDSDGAWGVLSGYSTFRREFTPDELKFILGIAHVLTEAKKLNTKYAAVELRELEFSRAFEYAANGFGLTTVQGQWVRVNRALCRMLGYTADELLAMNSRDVIYVEDLKADEDDKKKLLADEIAVFHREKRYVHKLGHIIWIQMSISLVRDKNGSPLHYVSQIQDISDRKVADLALRGSNDLFKTLAETMPQMVWMTMPNGQPTYANKLWIQYTGLTIETGSAEGWTNAFHPDELNQVKEAWGFALNSGNIYSLEARLRKHDGTFQWWLIRGLPLRDAEGKIFQWVGTCTDIDELKRALEQARAYENKIEEQSKLIQQARDAIILKDLDGTIKFWNEGAEKTYGWTSKEAVGKKSTDLYFADEAKHKANIQSLLRDGYWEGKCIQKTRSGKTITVGTRWTLSHDSNGNPKSILSIGTDITEIDKIQTQTFRAQRMESLGTLAGGIAHDLNNVLAPIMMSIELLKSGENDQERLSTLDTIDTCTRRGAEMIQKVLSFARGVDGDRNEIQPKYLVQEVERIISDTFLKTIQIKLKLASGLWSISGDTTQLHQVLLFKLIETTRKQMENLTSKINPSSISKSPTPDISHGSKI